MKEIPEFGVKVVDGKLVGYDAVQCEEMAHYLEEGELLIIKPKRAKPKAFRTLLQNSAMWLYFRKLADALNGAGWDMRRLLKPEIEIPWNKDTVCDYLWRNIQKPMTGHDSTKKLETKQVGEVYEVLSKHIAEKTGVTTPFPSQMTMMDEYFERNEDEQ